MASRLDQALDEVIRDRRNERTGGGRRHNNRGNNRGDFTRRRQVDSDGTIRKRLGPSESIKSFVRTVNVKNDARGARNVDSQWAHDLFDDDRVSSTPSIISRLGGRGGSSKANHGSVSRTTDISIENLHYDVTERDLVELFSTVADVVKAKLVFDPSGRSTGVASVTYNSIDDAEKAIKKYDNVALDGQAMKIELKQYTPRQPRVRSGGRFNNSRLDDRGSRSRHDDRGNRNNRRSRDDRKRDDNKKDDRNKQALTAEDLDREMDNYMKSNATANEDTDMILD